MASGSTRTLHVIASPRAYPGANSRRRPQRDERLGPNLLISDQLDPEALRDRGDDQLRLEHRELIADAAAGAAAEREVGESRTRGFALWRESIGIEALRIRPQLRPAMDDERDQEDDRSLRHAIAADLVVAEGQP